MSVQFGRRNFFGKPVDRDYCEKVCTLTDKYAVERTSIFLDGSLAMLFHPFHTTKESAFDHQPLTKGGVSLTWDGRLDNREDLAQQLRLGPIETMADAAIILVAYEEWGVGCFSKLIGDWALVVWDARNETLYLSKDFIGTRQLYYHHEPTRITWSTILDPLVLLADEPLRISEDYVRDYLSGFGATKQTPYQGILTVPAGKYLVIRERQASEHLHFRFDPTSEIRYLGDQDYEEHFRSVFGEAVRRRLRSPFPVLAELSGGMDSSSIVSMADVLVSRAAAETPRLDTISYFDDQEPNWDERPYVSVVEKKRGKEGHHIEVGTTRGAFEAPRDTFFPLPGYDRLAIHREFLFSTCLRESGSRVLLSGVGGDEFLGGVPTPVPELQDLLVRWQWFQMARRLFLWSLKKQTPWPQLAFETLEEFLPRPVRQLYQSPKLAPWLKKDFVSRHDGCLGLRPDARMRWSPRPSFQSNLFRLTLLARHLDSAHLSPTSHCQITYPYLDRDLLAFLFAIPREQIMRPGERRSLMRRALSRGITPPEILARKRKAYVSRQPLVLVEHAFDSISQLLECALLVEYEWTDRQALFAQLAAMRAGNLAHVIPFFNLLKLELWLRNAPHYSRQEHAFLGQRFAVLTGATGKRFSPTRLNM
jgi:asparagine synthase (glutamine-hydrolysing)